MATQALPAEMLTQLHRAVAAGIAARGGDPTASLARELLADRAAEAALEAERHARYEAVAAAPGGPLALCCRYADGDLTRQELVHHVAMYPYDEVDRDPYDDFSPQAPGGWWEVEDAEQIGLIDADLYAEVFERRHPGTAVSDPHGDPEPGGPDVSSRV